MLLKEKHLLSTSFVLFIGSIIFLCFAILNIVNQEFTVDLLLNAVLSVIMLMTACVIYKKYIKIKESKKWG